MYINIHVIYNAIIYANDNRYIKGIDTNKEKGYKSG